jgi:hypothetical protein
MTNPLRRSVASRRFALMLDDPSSGSALGGIVGMVDGGAIKADVIEQRIGAQARVVKTVGNPQFDPMTAQVGTAISSGLCTWIQDSFEGRCSRRNGTVLRLDLDGRVIHTINFREALITEVTVPACDPKATDFQSLSIKFQPEWSENVLADGEQIRGDIPSNQKLFNSRRFALTIDGVEPFQCTKVEAQTLKQDVKVFQVGSNQLPQLEPTKLTVPNLVFHVPLVDAGPLFDWHKTFVLEGQSSNANEKTAHLAFKSDMGDELIRIDYEGVGIISMTVSKSQAVGGQPEPSTVKVECYVEKMTISYVNASVS